MSERKAEHWTEEEIVEMMSSTGGYEFALRKILNLQARAEKAARRIAELEQDARRYRLLLQFIRYEAEPDGFQWATMEWCVEVASLAPATLHEAIDAAIDTSSVGPAGSPSQPEPPQ